MSNISSLPFDLWLAAVFGVICLCLVIVQRKKHLTLLVEAKALRQELQDKEESRAQLERRYLDESVQALREKSNFLAELQRVAEEKMSLSERFDLVQRILVLTPPVNKGLLEFARLIREDYSLFAAREASLSDEAGALMELQKIYRELELAIAFPAVLGKRILGVAGGFSSGKSEFINSFLPDNSVRLSVGITPVTVLPNYIVYSPAEIKIRGYCANGGSLELGANLYAKLSHEYIKSFGFDLRSVMPYVSVQAPISQELFEHIAIIDTPGYNPGKDDLTESFDRTIALEYVKQCDALIWVINIKAGTLPASDRDFIEQAAFSGKALYVVLNQADLMPLDDIQRIIEEVSSEFDFSGIECAGICAYSSILKKFYGFHEQQLEYFVKSFNQRRNEVHHLKKAINQVFCYYFDALERDIKTNELRSKEIKKLKMAALESGGTDEYDKMKRACEKLEDTFPKQDLKNMLKECTALQDKFFSCATEAIREARVLV